MMTPNQAMSKLLRAQHYLSTTYKYADDSVCAAWDELNAARYRVRDANVDRIAGRKAARKFGNECALTLICGEHPISRMIDDLSVNEAVKLAVKAAKNAFWAYPELREAEHAD